MRIPIPSGRFKQKKFSLKKEKALSFLQKVFANRATCPTESTSDEELVKVWCLELIKYVLFFTLMIITTNHFTTNDTVSLNQTIRQHFLDDYDFTGITTIDAAWDYLEEGFVSNLYQEPIANTIMIAKPRLRIQRVTASSCPRQVNAKLAPASSCYATYAPEHESTSDADDVGRYHHMGGVFMGRDFWGQVTPWIEHYHAGGYVAYLPKTDMAKASKKLEELRQAKWLDNGTRLLIVDFHLYNSNINQFAAVRLAFEIPPYGGVTPSHQIITLELAPRLGDFRAVFKQMLHGIFAGVTGFLLLEKVYEIITLGLGARLRSMSFLQSTAILLLSCFVMFHDLYRTIVINIDELIKCDPETADNGDECYLYVYMFWQKQMEFLKSFLLFMAFFPFYKFLYDFKSCSTMIKAFRCSIVYLASPLAVFMIIYLAYAQLGTMLFGQIIGKFKNVLHSFYTLFRFILGDFSYDEMEQGNGRLGPVFFLTFCFFVFFIMFNLIMAVINDTYAEIKAEEDARPDEDFPIGMWMEAKFESLQSSLTRLCSFCIEDNTPIWEALDHVHFLDNRIEWPKFRRRLLGEGADLEELIEVFENYDTDRDYVITQTEYQRMIAHVTTHHTLDNPTINRVETNEIKIGKQRGFVARLDFNDVMERLESIDEHIPDIESQLMQIETQLIQLNKQKTEQVAPVVAVDENKLADTKESPTKPTQRKPPPPPPPTKQTPVAASTNKPPPPPPPTDKKSLTTPTSTPAAKTEITSRPTAPPPPTPKTPSKVPPKATTTTTATPSKSSAGDQTSIKKPSKTDQNKQENKDTKSKTPNPRSGKNTGTADDAEQKTSDDDTYYDESDYYYYFSD